MGEQARISDELNQKKIGRVCEVLCEGYDPVAEMYEGRSEADAAEIDGKIWFKAPKNSIEEGSFVKVRITEAVDYDLVGEKV